MSAPCVVDIVIGAAMVQTLPGFDTVALTTVLCAHENGRDRGSGGNPI